jgi:hypothetical protein
MLGLAKAPRNETYKLQGPLAEMELWRTLVGDTVVLFCGLRLNFRGLTRLSFVSSARQLRCPRFREMVCDTPNWVQWYIFVLVAHRHTCNCKFNQPQKYQGINSSFLEVHFHHASLSSSCLAAFGLDRSRP